MKKIFIVFILIIGASLFILSNTNNKKSDENISSSTDIRYTVKGDIQKDLQENIDFKLNKKRDTLLVKSKSGVRFIEVVNSGESESDVYEVTGKDIKLSLKDFKSGRNTIIIHNYSGLINAVGINIEILSEVVYTESIENNTNESKVVKYYCIETVTNSFGSNSTKMFLREKDLPIKIKKNELDVRSKNGRRNTLELYEVHKDGTYVLIYKTK